MIRNIISIDMNAWNIVENGVIVLDKDNLTEAEKKDLMIHNQVWLFITNHLVPNKYHEVKNIASAKGVWEYLEKIGEGKSVGKRGRKQKISCLRFDNPRSSKKIAYKV